MKSFLLSLALLIGLCSPAAAQFDSLNMSMVAHLPYPNMNLNDVMGYVDSLGNEYALVGTNVGVSIVSLADPAHPVELFFLPGAASTWRDFALYGHYAYVTVEAPAGLRIIDLSALPNNVTFRDTTLWGNGSAHTVSIDEFGYAYVNGPDTALGGILILDVHTDPWNPVSVGSFSGHYVHDSYARDNLVYAAGITSSRFSIIDVSNKATPTVVGAGINPNGAPHTCWLDDTGDILFTADEQHDAYYKSWNVSDPANPILLDQYQSPRNEDFVSPHNQYWLNGFLVNSYYEVGVTILDVSHPSAMVEVGWYDNHPAPAGFEGVWAADPYLPSGLILASDIIDGLFIFQPQYVHAAFIEGTPTNALTGSPLAQVAMAITGTPEQATTDANGYYAMGLLDSASYQVTATAYGYYPADTVVWMIPGQNIIWSPRLQPRPVAGVHVHVQDAATGAPIPFAKVQILSGTFQELYQTNASGNLSNPSLLTETYEFSAWKWGYRQGHVTTAIDTLNNSVTIALQTGYEDDFMIDFGWTKTGNMGEGRWEIGIPQGTQDNFNLQACAPYADVTDDYGDRAFVTGNAGQVMDDDDVDSRTVLTSPLMDLSGWVNPMFRWKYWLVSLNTSGTPGTRDSIAVYVDNGSTQVLLKFKRDQITPFWRADSASIGGLIPLTATMRLIVVANDAALAGYVEAGFDDFDAIDLGVVGDDPQQRVLANRLQAWPVPFSGELHLRYALAQPAPATIVIADLSGKTLAIYPLEENEGEIVVAPDWPAGLYFASLIQENAQQSVIKIIRH